MVGSGNTQFAHCHEVSGSQLLNRPDCPAKADPESSRRDASGFFRFRFAESRLDLVRFYAGRRIAGLIQVLFFGSITHHSGMIYLGLLFWDFRDWLVGHAKPPCAKQRVNLCPTITVARCDQARSGSESTQSGQHRSPPQKPAPTREIGRIVTATQALSEPVHRSEPNNAVNYHHVTAQP